MSHDPVFLLAIFAGICVVLILATGIGGFARGGEFNRRNGNRMMRWRIIAQAIAFALMLLFLWMKGA